MSVKELFYRNLIPYNTNYQLVLIKRKKIKMVMKNIFDKIFLFVLLIFCKYITPKI